MLSRPFEFNSKILYFNKFDELILQKRVSKIIPKNVLWDWVRVILHKTL
jgi:hypothetical protein